MRNIALILAGAASVALVVVGGLYLFDKPAEAQRNVTARFEYAVITGSFQPFPADNPSVISSAVQVCYLQASGCQNEEVRSEVNLSKFIQDERLENSSRVRGLALERANQVAFSKAIAKLGSDGWEMVSAPAVEFDVYYLNQQGITSVKDGNRTDRQHIWFKRTRQ
ncbi:MAG: hypothetical protein JNJ39_17045 [Blastocatellia bacterium]|nr:hypothetical protein [Blastocatellia bacterium]